jgi:hypothetical protein
MTIFQTIYQLGKGISVKNFNLSKGMDIEYSKFSVQISVKDHRLPFLQDKGKGVY